MVSFENEMALRQRLKEVIAKALEIDQHLIGDKTRLVEDLGIDSLAALEMVFDIEGEFGIQFSEEEAKTVTSLENASCLVWKKISEATEKIESSNA